MLLILHPQWSSQLGNPGKQLPLLQSTSLWGNTRRKMIQPLLHTAQQSSWCILESPEQSIGLQGNPCTAAMQ
jgi:hypothetical protein